MRGRVLADFWRVFDGVLAWAAALCRLWTRVFFRRRLFVQGAEISGVCGSRGKNNMRIGKRKAPGGPL